MGRLLVLSLLLYPVAVEARSIVQLKGEERGFSALRVDRPGWRYLPAVDLYIVDRSTDLPRGEVVFEEEEEVIEVARTPNDPSFLQEWHLIGKGGFTDLTTVWDLTRGDPDLIVAILDTGVDLNHIDLRDNLWVNPYEIGSNGKDDDGNGYQDDLYGYDFVNRRPDPWDEAGHGTHLAGIIGAVGNNGIGVAGLNWHIRLLPLKIADGEGRGTTATAVEAIDYAIRSGARLINASWIVRPRKEDSPNVQALRHAIEKAHEWGVVFVTAAGNAEKGFSGRDVREAEVYPASFDLPNLIVAAAATKDGKLASFSNFGTRPADILAPGVSILSTLPGDRYGEMSGTSVASAYVCGAAALALSLYTEWEQEELLVALEGSTRGEESQGGLLDIGLVFSDSGKETTPSLQQRQGGGCSLRAGY